MDNNFDDQLNNDSNETQNTKQNIDNGINNVGSKLMQGVGVPKPLANIAAKTNGGPASPTNLPGAKGISNMAKNQLAKGGSSDAQRLNDAKNRGAQHNMLNSKNSQGNSNKSEQEEKSKTDQVGEEVSKQAASAGMQAAGVPKFLADAISDKVAGKLWKEVKKKIILYLVMGGLAVAGGGFLLICIIALLMAPMLFLQDSLEKVGDWFSSLGNWITGDGWCSDEVSCADHAETKFYEDVDKLYEKYKSYNDTGDFELDTDVIVAAALYDDFGDEDVNEEDADAVDSNDSIEDAAEKEKEKFQSARRRLNGLAKSLGEDGKNNYVAYKRYLKNTYLPKYYEDILYEDEKEKSYQLEMIATEIIAYSQNPDAIKAMASRNSNFNICQYVQVQDSETGSIEEITLETYVLGVVKAEGSVLTLEAQRALAIAARTYVLKKTNYCENPIVNSSAAQNFDEVDPTSDADLIANLAEVENLIMTIEGEIFLSEYDSYYKETELQSNGSGGYYCDDDYCYVNYCKLGANGSCVGTNKVKGSLENKNSFAGGHGRGMSQWGAHYLAKYESKGYEDILKYFYDSNLEIGELSYIDEEGLTIDPDTGFLMRVERTQRDNEFYYDINSNTGAAGTLEGECAWYATGRAKEILASINSPVTWSYNGNGGTYCDAGNHDKNKFRVSYDYNEPQQGAVISWKGGSHGYGHVAIVEKVYDDGTMLLSEAGISNGAYASIYGNGWIWDLPAGDLKNERRRKNCEDNDSGCIVYNTVNISNMKSRWGYDFQCYIYLTDPL